MIQMNHNETYFVVKYDNFSTSFCPLTLIILNELYLNSLRLFTPISVIVKLLILITAQYILDCLWLDLFLRFLFDHHLTTIFVSFVLFILNLRPELSRYDDESLPLISVRSCITCFGTPVMPKMLLSTESLPSMAFGTFASIAPRWPFVTWVHRFKVVGNFLRQPCSGHVKCFDFWCWCNTISLSNVLSQKKQNGLT